MRKKIIGLFSILVIILAISTTCFATNTSYMPDEISDVILFVKIVFGVIAFYMIGNIAMILYGIIKGKKEDREEISVAGFSILLFTIVIALLLIFVVFRMNITISKSLALLIIPSLIEIAMLGFAYRYAKNNNIKFIKIVSTILFLPIILSLIAILAIINPLISYIVVMALCIIMAFININKAKKINDIKRLKFGQISLIISSIFLILISFIYMEEIFIIVLPIAVLLIVIYSIYSIKHKYNVKLSILSVAILILTTISTLFNTGSVKYESSISSTNNLQFSNGTVAPNNFMSAGTALDSANIGFATGGAKDINNFRENLYNNYLPLISDITYEGLYYDYYFETGKTEQKDEMFYPSYSYAQSKDPISGEDEYYLSVGLNSNIKQEDFKRKKLNLVIALDISGSMNSGFNSYYYDQVAQYYNEIYSKYNYDSLSDVITAYNLDIPLPEGMEEDNLEDSTKTKMQIASESVNMLIDQLNENDRFGLVLFETQASVEKKLESIEDTNIKKLKDQILKIEALGGTNFEDGYTKATELMKPYLDVDQDEYENRIIVITDAMPNIGRGGGLLEDIKDNANDNISTTFIGVGVDFNTELVEELSKVRGANYYSVHNSKAFKDRMSKEFEYMVTPLVYDLSLKLESDTYSIEKVYGSNEADKATSEIMYVNTLFPSASNSQSQVKGGIILIKLKKNSNSNNDMKLTVEYKDRKLKEYSSEEKVIIPAKVGEHYDNTGIRKGIALTRYVNLLKNWLLYEKTEKAQYILDKEDGIVDFEYTENDIRDILGQYERTSEKLTVNKKYKEYFKTFNKYFKEEIKQIGDDTLEQEIKVLDKLINY